MLGPDDVSRYNIQMPANHTEQPASMRADLIRLSLLIEHGGVWMDASIYLTEGIDWIVDRMAAHAHPYAMFYDRRHPHPENWFIAVAGPRDPTLIRWRERFIQLLDREGPPTGTWCHDRVFSPYYTMYLAYCQLIASDPEVRRGFRSEAMLQIPSTDASMFHPLWPERKLTKLTRRDRPLFTRWVRYPAVPLYIALVLVFAAVAAAAAASARGRGHKR
jgi:hypothetical protein